MDPAEQLKLVHEFMLVIAPAVTRAHLDQGGYTPTETAKTVLEEAMHLSSQFAQCHDAFYATPENAPAANPLKTRIEKAAAVERETPSRESPVQPQD